MEPTTANQWDNLIYDWNVDSNPAPSPVHEVGLVDETLRDGLQSPSVRQPSVDDKIRLLHLMADLGIDDVDIGLPAAGERFLREAAILAQEVFEAGLPVDCYCAARTLEADIDPVAEVAQRVGQEIGVALFVGSSPIRLYTEGWEVADLLCKIERAVGFAVDQGLRVMFVTEDTTRTAPETVRDLYTAAIACGATQIALCDTVGHATPRGAERLVRFVRQFAGPDVVIDWHGHRDRGLGLACALAAVEAGADRVHATALGIGERLGNTPMEQVMVNLQLLGYIQRDLVHLPAYCRLASDVCNVPLPANQPVVGDDAFRTASGVHAAAVAKALEMEDHWLADRIYSGVPAAMVGRAQTIEIGPMSGGSNVRYALRQMDIEPCPELVGRILEVAKSLDHVMSEVELLRTVVGVLLTTRCATVDV